LTIHVYGTLPRQRQLIRSALGQAAKLKFFDSPPARGTRGRRAVLWVRFSGHSQEWSLRSKCDDVVIVRGGLGALVEAIRDAADCELAA